MNPNPVLNEITSLSPPAKQALVAALPGVAGATQPHQAQQMAPPATIAPPHMDNPVPAIGTPPQANVTPPLGSTQGDRNELARKESTGSGISQIMPKVEGALPNHPLLGKILGGAAEGIAGAGDIALHTINPRTEVAIPGTFGHHNLLVKQGQNQVAQEENADEKEAQMGSQRATTAKTTAETNNIPQDEALKQRVGEAQVNNLNSESENRGGEKEQWAESKAVGPEGEPLEFNKATGQYRTTQGVPGAKVNPKPEGKPDSPEQQYIDEYQKVHPGSSIAQALKSFKADTETPQRAPQVTVFIPNQEGGYTAQSVHPGQNVAPGAVTAQGMSTLNVPTTTQRTAAGRAQTVAAMAPDVLAEVQRLGPKLGPVAGRWNDFMQGKIGNEDPEFAGLRSDLTMMATAVALAHAQGRLPENLREEFDRMINAPHQDPKNIEATIHHIIPWMNKMAAQGSPHHGGEQQQQSVGNTNKPDGDYVMNGKTYHVKGGQVYE